MLPLGVPSIAADGVAGVNRKAILVGEAGNNRVTVIVTLFVLLNAPTVAVNVALPIPTAVTSPLVSTVATPGLLEA